MAVLFGNFDAFFYLLYPLAYFYVRGMLEQNVRFRSKDLFHFIPFLLQLFDMLPYSLTSFAHKIVIAELIKFDIHEVVKQQLGFFISSRFHFYVKLLLSTVYVFYSCELYFRLRPRNAKNFILHYWIPGFLFLQILLILFLTYFFLIAPNGNHYKLNYQGDSSWNYAGLGAYLVLSLSVFYFPEFLYAPYINAEREAKLKIPNYELSAEKLIEIETKLDLYLEEFKPFLKTTFSLAQLSATLDIPVHHFNYYFRKTQQSNFLEQRMRWRIRHAKELIDAGKDKVLTLEAIGLESGFQSRTTFFVNFKELVGESPSAYAERKSR
ncbi:helix-turn-helix domain-containing protein [Aquirufa sp. HETE-83D]|uniref:Helix-turn-helix domain-containing protein n=1 Tax=Aquirufa esocilacus TaxID=3096513 RepID=A0ABW6DJ73_9BACT